MQPEPPDELEVVSQSRWYVLAETQDGYGIWRAGQPRTETPLAIFGENADDFADADREYRRLNRWMRVNKQLVPTLAWMVFIGAALWTVTSIVDILWQFAATDFRTLSFVGGGPPAWINVLERLTQPLWEGALAAMLALWLLRRAEGRRHHG